MTKPLRSGHASPSCWTALVNRPAYQPLRRGQRLQITGRRCGTRLIADRIEFTGPTVAPERYRSPPARSRRRSVPWSTLLMIGAAGLAFAGIVRYEFRR